MALLEQGRQIIKHRFTEYVLERHRTFSPVLIVPRGSIHPAEFSIHQLPSNPGILEIYSIFPCFAPLYSHLSTLSTLSTTPGWPVLDHLRHELVLSLTVNAGQVCSFSLLATVSPAGCDVMFVRHQKVAVILELRPGLGADHWTIMNKIK